MVAASAQGLTFEETKIDRAALSARIVDGLKKTSTLTLDLKSAAASGVKIGTSQASFVGTLEKHTIKLSGSARKDTLEGALDLALTGGLDEALSLAGRAIFPRQAFSFRSENCACKTVQR